MNRKMFFWRFLVNAIGIVIVVRLFTGITAVDTFSMLLAALILGLINSVIRPVLLVLTLPFNVLTLGLLTLFINALMLELAAWIVPGFEVSSFAAAFFGAIIISIISVFLSLIIGKPRS
ncbi:MAG: phage holin family protein [Clostridia bacterium]|nr:phage holin family protein [Clostridia bacterium]MDD4797937.1 phage holin family protein [Clostridia bacterium]